MVQAASGAWWDGTSVLAGSPPVFVAQGRCGSYGGWLALSAGGPLSKVCGDDGGSQGGGGILSGSPRGVAWFEDYDLDGPFVGVELVGGAVIGQDAYRALGPMDVVFEGGTFTADFAACEHRTESGYSSCVALVTGASLPPGGFVGAATAGTEPPRTSRGAGAAGATDEAPSTPAAERAALVALYTAAGGPNWTRNTNWNTEAAVSDWYVVTTDQAGSVTDLYLFRNNLSGSIPTELGNLTNLAWLSLSSNSLSGSIPTELGSLTNLAWLSLSSNSLSGSIPTELGSLTNLAWLYLHRNSLSGSIPTELTSLTNLTQLYLHRNSLSGSIPTELTSLTNLTQLYLYSNNLSGSIPTELGNLTNLTQLYLYSNNLSGCVPAALAAVRSVRFDPGLSYCELARVSLTDARSDEGDATVVFTATLTPSNTADAAAASSVSFDYATAAGTATAGSDYTPLSGTLTIPAGGRRATITVQLLDDSAAESTESFTLRLTNPQGAVLSDTTATATIIDDDGPAPNPAAPATVCDGATIQGSVGDVFEVTQAGFDGWHHVLVDLDVTCGDLSSAVGYPTAVTVISGPTASIGASRHCLTHTGALATTASVAAAAGCPTFASPVPAEFTRDGRSTHLLWIPDTLIGLAHQILVWVDADGDGAHDLGERYGILNVPRFDAVSIGEVLRAEPVGGGVPLARPGRRVLVGLELQNSAGQSLSSTPIRAEIVLGPSTGASVMCFYARSRGGGQQQQCATDGEGRVYLVYEVSTTVDPFRRENDYLQVYVDSNGNGRYDSGRPPTMLGEPVHMRPVVVAKAINYVALGDSYSAGENGRQDGSTGRIYREVSPADPECRRWVDAYPVVFSETLTGTVTFGTHACVGARTFNIHDPSAAAETRRPSPSAPEATDTANWEPRQIDSLLASQRMQSVDMVTLTIGGNDLGFASVLQKCFLYTCDAGDVGLDRATGAEESAGPLVAVESRIVAVLEEIKEAAPNASIFVLGYPRATPVRASTLCPSLSLAPAAAEVVELAGLVGSPSAYYLRALRLHQDVAVELAVELGIEGVLLLSDLFVEAHALLTENVERAEAAVELAKAVGVDLGEAGLRSQGEAYLARSRADAAAADELLRRAEMAIIAFGEAQMDVSDARLAANLAMLEALRAAIEDTRDLAAEMAALHGEGRLAEAEARVATAEAAYQRARGLLKSLADRGVEAYSNFSGSGRLFQRLIEGVSILGRDARGPRVSAADAAVEVADIMQGILEPLQIEDEERTFLRETAMLLNAKIADAAARAGVHFVDVATHFDGHEPCNAARNDEWINGLVGQDVVRLDAARLDIDSLAQVSGPTDALIDVLDQIRPVLFKPVSDRPFHPNAAGHQQYAMALQGYIEDEDWVADDGESQVSDAGLPLNSAARSLDDGPSGGPPSHVRGVERGPGVEGPGTSQELPGTNTRATGGDSEKADTQARPSVGLGLLSAQRAAAGGSGCAAPAFVAGESVQLVASGFAPGSSVRLSVDSATMSGTPFALVDLPSATADASGQVEVSWTIPGGSVVEDDTQPRMYSVGAGGRDSEDRTLVARTLLPLVAYPGAAPCAADDSAVTALGEAVEVDLLANDTVPGVGALVPASVRVGRVAAGEFTVDRSDGSARFVPRRGFAGIVEAPYSVMDIFGIESRARVTVRVDAGCTITGAAGVVEIEGTDGDDVICVPDPSDHLAFHVIDAKAGNDIILGGDGVDWIYGGPGDDTVYGRGGDDVIDAGPGADTVHGGDGFDTIRSDDLSDTVTDSASGHEIIIDAPPAPRTGPETNDDREHAAPAATLTVDVLGNDYDPDGDLDYATLRITQQSAAGTARIAAPGHSGAAVEYTAGPVDGVDTFTYEICDRLGACASAQVTVTVGTTGCTIAGTDASETLYGTADDDVICGLGGDDTIYGLGGDDIIVGGAGDDSLYGGAGNDTLWGGDGDDTLEGNGRDDIIVGGPGDDVIVGGGGDDTIWGGLGADALDGHAGDDTVHGGDGDDTVRGGNGADTLFGGAGNDSLTGWAGADTLYGGSGDDSLEGNTQDDVLWGGDGDDDLYGAGHDDWLYGGAGDDAVRGGAGDDFAFGNQGDDTLDGGNGSDYLHGGGGADTCTRGETVAGCETAGGRSGAG